LVATDKEIKRRRVQNSLSSPLVPILSATDLIIIRPPVANLSLTKPLEKSGLIKAIQILGTPVIWAAFDWGNFWSSTLSKKFDSENYFRHSGCVERQIFTRSARNF